jgi:hypothetical protein
VIINDRRRLPFGEHSLRTPRRIRQECSVRDDCLLLRNVLHECVYAAPEEFVGRRAYPRAVVGQRGPSPARLHDTSKRASAGPRKWGIGSTHHICATCD